MMAVMILPLFNTRQLNPDTLPTLLFMMPNGRPVRNLVKNATLGLQGYWIWDGLDDKKLKLPCGFLYFIYRDL
jgi:hypothetical protein